MTYLQLISQANMMDADAGSADPRMLWPKYPLQHGQIMPAPQEVQMQINPLGSLLQLLQRVLFSGCGDASPYQPPVPNPGAGHVHSYGPFAIPGGGYMHQPVGGYPDAGPGPS